jgi:hypothetical protein
MEVFMKIERIYIGGWFQRTMLQLTEIYDFLREGTSRLDLNKKKLLELHENLSLKEVNYELNGFEYLTFSTTLGINLKIFEDGLIVLSDDNTTEDKLFNDIDALASYYETKLSPALSYIFSLGAPVPKELANIKTVYPYFIVLKNATKTDINELLAKTDKQKYFEFSNDNFDVLRGDKYYFINTRNKNLDQVERFIEEQIFIREFKGQLHHYLNLHRTIWEKIADVKENAKVKGKDIVEFSSKIDGYAKTINLVDARINQMNTYLRTREKIAKNDENLKEFLEVFEYKYETLGDTLAYMQQIWAMTKNYVNSAAALFNGLQQEITQKSLDNLTIVTSMGVGASLIGLFTATEMPVFTIFGVGYFLSLALVGYLVNRTMKYISENRKYHITDIEYDKNIK